jgi:hypothetical protein
MLATIRKFFTAGTQLPVELRSQLDAEGVLYIANRVAVISRFSGSVPGLHSGASISRTTGALAFTSQRAIATLASRSNPALLVVDCRWDATVVGPLKVEISETGVQIDLDVARVDPRFHGHLALHYKTKLSDDVLARIPKKSLTQSISAEYVSLILGVRPRT